MGYVPAEGECGTLTVDKVPSYAQSGDTVSRITAEDIVIRTDRGLWVAANQTPDILDAEEIG